MLKRMIGVILVLGVIFGDCEAARAMLSTFAFDKHDSANGPESGMQDVDYYWSNPYSKE